MNQALPDLFAHFTIRRGLLRKEAVEASLFELDAFGCVMKTDKLFEPGDTLVLDLVMKMPFDSIRAEGLSGLITERTKHCSNYFYSIDFKELLESKNPHISEKMRRIREVLSKKQSLLSRRSSGPESRSRQPA